MTWPLRILAVLAIFGGVMGLDRYIDQAFPAGEHTAHALSFAEALVDPFGHSPAAAFLGLFATMVGFSAAWAAYSGAKSDPLPGVLGWVTRAMRDRFYFDEIYQFLIRITHDALASLADAFDRWIVSGLCIRGLHGSVELCGRVLRLAQSGNLQTYAFFLVAGLVVVIYVALSH